MFQHTQKADVQRGNFLMLFTSFARFRKYLACILIGLPTWFVIGLLVTLAPEFSQELGFPTKAKAGMAIMFAYIGISLGDLATGLLSQWLRSRRQVVLLCVIGASLSIALYLLAPIKTMEFFYFNCFLLGFSMGYWALFVTIAAEQFGTNLRATIATTAPNFVRGALPLILLAYEWGKPVYGMITSAMLVGSVVMGITLLALAFLDETFSKDLNYHEEH
jgi:hypothetical protein